MQPERSIATILFTDIVGSTERATELGDRGWRDLLEHQLVGHGDPNEAAVNDQEGAADKGGRSDPHQGANLTQRVEEAQAGRPAPTTPKGSSTGSETRLGSCQRMSFSRCLRQRANRFGASSNSWTGSRRTPARVF